MDLTRLLNPQSVAVIGATDRRGSYGEDTLRNLITMGFPGNIYPVNPKYEQVAQRKCYPNLSELPEPVDVAIVAIPAAHVPPIIDEAGAIGCGGAIVLSAGFAETKQGEELEAELKTAALRHNIPVCGPNCNGIVLFHQRAALWGDALQQRQPGSVAFISQSGNLALNALAVHGGLNFHTVISCGNQTVVDAVDYLLSLADIDGVRSIALYVESDGDGEKLALALARCIERNIGVAVLKAGSSTAGSAAAKAHTGALAGDQRVFQALIQEAGATWAHDGHELLEFAKALSVSRKSPKRLVDNSSSRSIRKISRRSKHRPGLAILTCAGGDSTISADNATKRGIYLPEFAPETERRLTTLLPSAATVGNPLDYTSMIWGEIEALRDIIETVSQDPNVDQLLILFDQPATLDGALAESWAAVRLGIQAGAKKISIPLVVGATLPELLDNQAAQEFIDSGIPAIAGLGPALQTISALQTPPGDGVRLHAIAKACREIKTKESQGFNNSLAINGKKNGWLSEFDTKLLLAKYSIPIPIGCVTTTESEALVFARELKKPVAMKLSSPELQHKSDTRALELNINNESQLKTAFQRLNSIDTYKPASVFVEEMIKEGVELIMAVRRDGVVPNLVIGLGGIWTEILEDVIILPLPVEQQDVEAAFHALHGAPILYNDRGGGEESPDLKSAAAIATGIAKIMFDHRLELIELNPVIVGNDGAVVVDAIARYKMEPRL